MAFFRHLIEALVNPFFLIYLLLTFLFINAYRQGNLSHHRKGILLIFFLLLTLGTGWVPKLLTQRLEGQYTPINIPDPGIHWVVVLSGGQSNSTNKPDNMLLAGESIKRLVEGVRLYRQLPKAKLILSGGGYGAQIPEANRLATLTNWFGVPKKDRVLEIHSINTADQALEIKKLLGREPFYLVTSAIHMSRSMKLCQTQGLRPIPAPSDFTDYWNDERWEKYAIPNAKNFVFLSIALHEMLGLWWGKLTGVIV